MARYRYKEKYIVRKDSLLGKMRAQRQYETERNIRHGIKILVYCALAAAVIYGLMSLYEKLGWLIG